MISKIHQIRKPIMITIENRKTEITDVAGYADIMKMIMEVRTVEGMTTGEMKTAFKLIDILESATKENKETFELEEDDFKLFLKRFPADFKWGLQSRDIAAFDDYIRAIPLTNP